MIAPASAVPLRQPVSFPSWDALASTCVLGAALRDPDFVSCCRADLAALPVPFDLVPLHAAILASVPRRWPWRLRSITPATLHARLVDAGCGNAADAVMARTANFAWLGAAVPDDLAVGAVMLILECFRGEGDPMPEVFAAIERAMSQPWKATPSAWWCRMLVQFGKAVRSKFFNPVRGSGK